MVQAAVSTRYVFDLQVCTELNCRLTLQIAPLDSMVSCYVLRVARGMLRTVGAWRSPAMCSGALRIAGG
jgi:hypothetical protein